MSSPTPGTQIFVNVVCDHEENMADETDGSEGKTNRVPSPPTLRIERIEQLRDEDGGSSSAYTYTSEEDLGSHCSDEGERTHFETPSLELKEKIIAQAEFYFSDVNILKDAFLLKHVRRNKLGYVSLKLITSFKKLKSLTRDYRAVAYSLRQSDKLEVNEEGTKVRRVDPLPDYDETTPSRTVVAVNLPTENPTIETVAEIFSKCGEVALIRVLRPGKTVPPDVKKHSAKHPEIGTTVCAVVEFEKHEHAKKACAEMNDTSDWRKGMRVVMLASPKSKSSNKKEKHEDKKSEDNGEDDNEDKKKRKRSGKKKRTRLEEIAGENDSSCYSSGSEGEGSARPQRLSPKAKNVDPNHLSPNQSPRSSPRSTPKTSPMSSPRNQRKGRGSHGKSPLAELSPGDNRLSPRSSPELIRKKGDNSSGESTPSSPWVQRRLKAAQELLDKSPCGSPRLGRRNPDGTIAVGASPKMLDMAGVCRQPRGPDGTLGFNGGIGRGKPRSATVS